MLPLAFTKPLKNAFAREATVQTVVPPLEKLIRFPVVPFAELKEIPCAAVPMPDAFNEISDAVESLLVAV